MLKNTIFALTLGAAMALGGAANAADKSRSVCHIRHQLMLGQQV